MEQVIKKFSYRKALTSARKAGLLLPLIKGLSAQKALLNLGFSDKKTSVFWEKLIRSAISAFPDTDSSNLIIKEAYVGPDSTIKTGRVGSRSKFKRILKRRSNLYIEVLRENTKEKKNAKEIKENKK